MRYLVDNKRHMQKNGIINPILVMSVLTRPPYVTSGVTRAHCAKLWDLPLMAVVYDPADRYTHLPTISCHDVAKKFPSGLIYNGFPQGVPDLAAMPVNLKW